METILYFTQTVAGSLFLIAGLLLAFYYVARPLLNRDTKE
jgi:hypothetical protein